MFSFASILAVPEGTVNEWRVLSLLLLTVPVKVVTLRGSACCSACALRVAVEVGGVYARASGIVMTAKDRIRKTANTNLLEFIFLISRFLFT
jgi:hypothetical protein